MLARIDRRRRDLALLLGALLIIVITIATASLPAGAQERFSTRNSGPQGMLAAYKWLAAEGYGPQRQSTLNLSHLPPSSSTIMLFQPGVPLGHRDARSLLAWVRSGGVIVSDLLPVYRWLASSAGAVRKRIVRAHVHLVQPLVGRPPVARLRGSTASAMSSKNGAAIAKAGGHDVVEQWRDGAGVVWLISAPALIDNAHLNTRGNASLLLALAGPRPRTVTFAELVPHTSSRPNASNWLFTLPWGIAVIFVAVIVLLYRWLSGIRLGPPLPVQDDGYRPSTQYVSAVAGLLRKSKHRGEILALYQERARRASETASGHPSIPDDLGITRQSLSESELVELAGRLAAIEDGRAENVE